MRPSLVFRRTARGDAQVRHPEHALPLHIGRLLLLFEGPQSVDDLRQMIDEPWLPEALIELQRRRLIERLPAPVAVRSNLAANESPTDGIPASAIIDRAGSDGSPLGNRLERVRSVFLQQLGPLGTDMGRRIDQCRSEQELDELMPQVDALVEAIAGRDALVRFREQTARNSG